ncbi:MAG: protein kinase [Microbacterium sp.]|uniref:serine/threonine-protein kinase n=1 Tax=Microbacterium sp. TaxID=51671 RepID=UPI00261063E9|nr:serine/threonine-protein kinase [Microbacterium sp.]MCX6501569.1 protein kinase [Microbacterium sp.]
MPPRPPSQPPVLPGFDHIKLLGRGGFADVFLYQQLHPRRQVAVKVLLKDRLGTTSAEGFTEEANLMAQLATHPSIVSVYQAGVSDDGRPYLVMEYCSKPNLQARHKRERFSEAETLRVGVQIAGAVETAHRAGILHRDIKPANILVTDYGRPALTDFGISATTSDALSGMSIPWSPPESLRTPPQGFPSSDVYSLAATLYTLLTNRSPFEIPGASNTELDVMARIQSMALPSTGRQDVSSALQAVLERAMSKDPAQRYASAIEFARALQRVQIEHGMQATQIDVLEEELLEEDEEDGEERTRFRGVTSIDAQSATAVVPPHTLPSAPGFIVPSPPTSPSLFPGGDETRARSLSGATLPPRPVPAGITAPPSPLPLDATIVRAPESISVDDGPSAAPKRRRLAWMLTAAAVIVVGAGVGIAVALAPAGVGTPSAQESAAAPVDPVNEEVPPQVSALAGTATSEGIAFTWTNPDPVTGDVYLWRPVVPGEEFPFEETESATATVAPDGSGRACIEVVLRRADGTSAADSVEGCAP